VYYPAYVVDGQIELWDNRRNFIIPRKREKAVMGTSTSESLPANLGTVKARSEERMENHPGAAIWNSRKV